MKNIVRLLLILLCSLSLLLPVTVFGDAAAGGEYNYQSVYYYVVVSAPDGYVNLRYGPGLEYGIIRPIYNGEYLLVTATQNNYYDGLLWGQTEYAGNYGWISISQTTITDDPYSQPVTQAPQQTYNHADEYVIVDAWDGYCNLRSGAGISYPIITPIYNGEVLYLTQRSYNPSDDLVWGYTEYHGQYGWISISQTSPYTPPVEPVTTAPPETAAAPPENTTAPPETTTASPETTTAPPETTSEEETTVPEDSEKTRLERYLEWLKDHMVTLTPDTAVDLTDAESPVMQDDFIYIYDVTGDGKEELIITHYFDENSMEYLDTSGDGATDKILCHPLEQPELSYFLDDVIRMDVYTIRNNQIAKIYEYDASYSHIGWTYLLLVPCQDNFAFLNYIESEWQGVSSGGYEYYNLSEDGTMQMISSEYWDGKDIPQSASAVIDPLMKESMIVLNTQFEDEERGSCHMEDWQTKPLSVSQETVQLLTGSSWFLTIDGQTITLTFEGDETKMEMYFGTTQDTMQKASVILAFSSETSEVRIVDNSILRQSMPSLIKGNYQIILDREKQNLTLSSTSGDYILEHMLP